VSRRAPRPIAEAILPLQRTLAPATLLAEVQRVWATVVGEAIAREAAPTGERAGVVTVTCSASVWANELDLMAPLLIERINAAVHGPEVKRLRCVTTTLGRSRRGR